MSDPVRLCRWDVSWAECLSQVCVSVEVALPIGRRWNRVGPFANILIFWAYWEKLVGGHAGRDPSLRRLKFTLEVTGLWSWSVFDVAVAWVLQLQNAQGVPGHRVSVPVISSCLAILFACAFALQVAKLIDVIGVGSINSQMDEWLTSRVCSLPTSFSTFLKCDARIVPVSWTTTATCTIFEYLFEIHAWTRIFTFDANRRSIAFYDVRFSRNREWISGCHLNMASSIFVFTSFIKQLAFGDRTVSWLRVNIERCSR